MKTDATKSLSATKYPSAGMLTPMVNALAMSIDDQFTWPTILSFHGWLAPCA